MRRLGRSDLSVPPIGLGTWSVFDTDRDLRWLVDEALAAGVTLFDSSPMYGQAERCLARALGDRRPEAIVATKISAVDAERGERQISEALTLFGRIDLYQIHNIVSWKLHLPRLEALKKEGLVGAIGISQGLLVSDDAFEEVMRTGIVDSVQVRYNPNRQGAADRIIPIAADLGLAIFVMQPLRWGVLLASPADHELEMLQVSSWGEAVIRWILTDDRITTILTATASPGRIGTNADAARLPPFSPDEKALVESIIARGPAAGCTPLHSPSPSDLVRPIGSFLSARLGACYCDICIGREFAVSAAIAAQVRGMLPGKAFANEVGPCLSCGSMREIARSRTIMR